MTKNKPSIDEWLKEAKADKNAGNVGMYLTHNGVVRATAREKVREGRSDAPPVTAMMFSYNEDKLSEVIEDARKLSGIYYVRVWLNEGRLEVGDDIMFVLIGGDIRVRVVEALQYLVGRIKSECVVETEITL